MFGSHAADRSSGQFFRIAEDLHRGEGLVPKGFGS
ncbi:hypothetical protein RUM8411_03304 [Ruegeria meonggei]|uniref:Uncharacterized protein n=1 Tax=Ruegeria meonggei TaxID=1446476 RepID=A0A1X6ZZE9_9RHOB|nr:hypothetical protein RUM8411_03304 [Ruegeria meonggei]